MHQLSCRSFIAASASKQLADNCAKKTEFRNILRTSVDEQNAVNTTEASCFLQISIEFQCQIDEQDHGTFQRTKL